MPDLASREWRIELAVPYTTIAASDGAEVVAHTKSGALYLITVRASERITLADYERMLEQGDLQRIDDPREVVGIDRVRGSLCGD